MIENKILSYDYFMDVCNEYELNDLIKLIPYANKNEWERTRLQMFYTVAPYLKQSERNKSVQELFPLITDEKVAEEKAAEPLSQDEINRMREMSKRIQQQLFENENNHVM